MKRPHIHWVVLVSCLGLAAAAGCATTPEGPDPLESSSEEGGAPQGATKPDAAVEAKNTPVRPPSAYSGTGAGSASLGEAKKMLEDGKLEDLLGVFEPDQAKKLNPGQAAELVEIYFRAAQVLRDKFKDVSFSSLYCERGLLLSPRHAGMLRLQIRNYLSPEMRLVGGAEELSETLVAVDGADQENQLLRGTVAFELGNYDVALQWVQKAARTGQPDRPINKEAWALLNQIKTRQEEVRSSLTMVKELEAMAARLKNLPSNPTRPEIEHQGGDEPAELAGGRVVLYMTSWCQYCAKARAHLKGLGVKFEEKDIEKDPGARMELMELAQSRGVAVHGVPVTRVGNTLVVGYNPQRVESLIQQLK